VHILVNDFIGGALDRGIPLYVRNLIEGLREEGLRISVVRAPAFCRKLPRGLFYLIAVLVEQFALPVIGLWWRAELTLYPYNSIAIADALTGRGRIVVHDLEQLNRPLSFSKLYYLACYRALKWRNAPIFTISEISRQRLIKSGLFGRGPITLLPNTFYEFERLLRDEAPGRKGGILLCTGSTANKDLETVVADYLPKALARPDRVSIVGLHKADDAMKLAPLQSFRASGQLRLCGRLSDRQVANEYQSHAIVWVHSLREGFGRCVVEGRLAGCRVIAKNIPEFAVLRDGDVFLYNDAAEFAAILDRLLRTDTPPAPYAAYPYRELLRNAVERGLRVTEARSAAQPPQATSIPQSQAHRIPPQNQSP
jgi:glycosyltransferase involved in cell wall biosynthesis